MQLALRAEFTCGVGAEMVDGKERKEQAPLLQAQVKMTFWVFFFFLLLVLDI